MRQRGEKKVFSAPTPTSRSLYVTTLSLVAASHMAPRRDEAASRSLEKRLRIPLCSSKLVPLDVSFRLISAFCRFYQGLLSFASRSRQCFFSCSDLLCMHRTASLLRTAMSNLVAPVLAFSFARPLLAATYVRLPRRVNQT